MDELPKIPLADLQGANTNAVDPSHALLISS